MTVLSFLFLMGAFRLFDRIADSFARNRAVEDGRPSQPAANGV
jgi:hypothetical protein